jgi:hypothetical protein
VTGVVELDPAELVRVAADVYDARVRRRAQASEQQAGEREVAEVVGAELQLEAVGGLAVRRGHDAGIVDQQVEALVRATSRERSHGIERAEVERLDVERRGRRALADRSRGALALGRVAAGEHDVRAGASERAASMPMPLLAPVITAMRPCWSGTSNGARGIATA